MESPFGTDTVDEQVLDPMPEGHVIAFKFKSRHNHTSLNLPA